MGQVQETTRREDSPHAPPGARRIGSFELVELVSAGESTCVYRGWDHGLDRPVAIKEYFPRALARRDAAGEVRPVWAEADALFQRGRSERIALWRDLARCDSAALLRVLHVFDAHGTTYAVMPWHEGRLLSSLGDDGRLPMAEDALRSLLGQLLGALEALHRTGRIHGRVVPTKVLWHDGAAVLLEPLSGPAGAAAATASAADLRALAALGRYCITGILPSAAGVPESLASSVETLAFERLSTRYSADLLGLFDADAAGADAVESFRQRLRTRAAPSQAASPAAATADRPETAEPALPPDAETAALIRRVLASIPDRVDAAAKVPRHEPLMFATPVVDLDAVHDEPRAPTPRPLRRKPGLFRRAFSLVAVVAVAAGAWKLSGVDLLRVAEDAIPMPTRPASAVAAPVAPQPEPGLPPAAPPTSPSVADAAPVPPAPVDVAPAAAAPPPVPPAAIATPAPPPARTATGPSSPRTACGGRTEFSLYRCMQRQCDLAQWRSHAECRRLRATDSVG